MNLNSKTASKIIKDFWVKDSDYWQKVEEHTALDLFHKAAKHIPAYQSFLKQHNIDPNKIKTFSDFKHVPVTNKKNYLQKYPYRSLLWEGNFDKTLVYSATSGSTGVPFYFPRDRVLDWESSLLHELFLSQNHNIKEEPTLVIIGFSVGVWIAGLLTNTAFAEASRRAGYPLSIISPGINKNEIFKTLKNLAPYYKQVLLVGYPPFVKDIIDEAKNEGIDVKKLNLRILCAAEPFSENFRDYLFNSAKIRNRFLDISNIYGSSDLGTMAIETPISILARTLAIKNDDLFHSLFNNISKTPTLAQYNPHAISFEDVEGELILSSNSAIPLIRYAIGDNGGKFSFEELNKKFENFGIDLDKQASKAKIDKYIYKLPFVYVYERKDLSTTLYGLQVYPEVIKEALIQDSVSKYLTGKFTLQTKFDKRNNQFLEINLELKPGQKATSALKQLVLAKIVKTLQSKSSEYRELFSFIKDKAKPHLVFWPVGHPLYFKSGTKQKWVLKS